jgi:DNA modification methylase/uncharacterized ParB-like nuclease family protein
MKPAMSPELLPLAVIRTDGGTQPRAALDEAVIAEYAEALREGAHFPPVVVFHDGRDYWLADGFHRLHAAARAGRAELAADVRQGDRRAAVLHAVGANAEHGLRRTGADKRRAVLCLLGDAEWREWPQGEIARRCVVSREYVNRLSRELAPTCDRSQDRRRTVRRGAITYTMDTRGIGAARDAGGLPGDPPPPWLGAGSPVAQGAAFPPEPAVAEAAAAGPVTIHCADARRLAELLPAESVQLVVTSPPYNVGIPYGAHDDALPEAAYFALLDAVLAGCRRALAPGGRIAVVAPFGIGRDPWRPLAARLLERLVAAGFALRGQIVWHKGTTGNRTSWGSFRLPSDPALRDTTEAILVAHKAPGRLALPDAVLAQDVKGRCSPWLADPADFMALAQDYWPVAPESATRLGHPAPFPAALAQRLIRFYAYPGAHVLDPFAGSGTVGVAALRLGCRATLVDIDPAYCALARSRCQDELSGQQ